MKSKFTWQQEEEFLKLCFKFSIDDAIEWVHQSLNPEDVFDDKTLNDWAEENGYIKK